MLPAMYRNSSSPTSSPALPHSFDFSYSLRVWVVISLWCLLLMTNGGEYLFQVLITMAVKALFKSFAHMFLSCLSY